MKKKISQFVIILICAIMLSVFYAPKHVEAAPTMDSNIVYFQALVKSNNGDQYSAIQAVSQYYFSDTTKGTIIGNKSQFHNLADQNLVCNDELYTNIYDLCTYNESDKIWKLNPTITTLMMSKNGDMSIMVENEYTLATVRIYYVIAKPGVLFCESDYTMCQTAASIAGAQYGGMSAWKNRSKSGFMAYASIDIPEHFDVIEENTGRRSYVGYNILNELPSSDLVDAQEYGVYATVSITVQKNVGDTVVTYYLNDYTIDGRTFAGVGNTDAGENYSKQLIVNHEPTSKYTYGNHAGVDGVQHISNVAVLIRANENKDVNKNQAFTATQRYFDNTIRPILAIAIGALFLVVGTTTGAKIVKSSDEPEERRAAIKHLIGLFIGALIIYLIMFFYADVIAAFSRFLG